MSVPIVGQAVTLITWYPTAVLRCNCVQERLSVVILTGLKNPVLCGNCKRGYFIDAICPDGTINVGHYAPTPSKEVM